MPEPAFPYIYSTCASLGAECRKYKLKPDQDWEIDIEQLKTLVDSKTKAIYIINPSNPCGSVFSKKHQLEIIDFCNEYKIPIFSDEVYYGMNHGDGTEFHSFGHLTKEVPVICTASISKIFCMPGWRLGWILFYNNHSYFDKLIEKCSNMPPFFDSTTNFL